MVSIKLQIFATSFMKLSTVKRLYSAHLFLTDSFLRNGWNDFQTLIKYLSVADNL